MYLLSGHMKSSYGGFSRIMQWLWVPVLALLVYVAYRLLNTLFGSKGGTLDVPQNDNYPEATISLMQGEAYAQRLYSAMNQFGTDESAIENVFSELSINNALVVYNAFGRRSYDNIGVAGLPWVNKIDLSQWLKNELSAKESAYIAAAEKLEPHGLF